MTTDSRSEMITDRDICIEVVALEKDPKGLKVEDVMSAPVCTASADETVVDALARMREQGILQTAGCRQR